MIIESIIAALSTGGLGAIVGSVGGIAEKVWSKKIETQLKIKEWEHIENLHQLQMQSDAAKADQDLMIVQTQGDWSALESSIQAEMSLSEVSPWVNNFRALIRPTLTVGTLVLSYYDPTYLTLAVFCVSWWFGSRGTAEGPR